MCRALDHTVGSGLTDGMHAEVELRSRKVALKQADRNSSP